MALNKDILGFALYSARADFSDKTLNELITEYGSLESARLAMCKVDAEEIINHFKAAGVINVNVVTTGTATNHTGTGIGTIS